MYNRFEKDHSLLEKYRTELDNPQTLPTQLLIIAGICAKEGNMLIRTTATDIQQQSVGLEYLTVGLELYLAAYKKTSLQLCKKCFESISRELFLMLDELNIRRAKVEQLVAEYNQIKKE